MKSGGGGGGGGGGNNILDYILLAVLYNSRRVWGHAPPESVLVGIFVL